MDWDRLVLIMLCLVFGNIVGYIFGYYRAIMDIRKGKEFKFK